jgi:serine/threonine-protein kinase
MQLLRDGDVGNAADVFERAAKLDPALVTADLRACTTKVLANFYSLGNASQRRHVEQATAGRASLSEHDRVLLDAVEPLFRQAPDFGESSRRFGAALESAPEDVEFLLWRGVVTSYDSPQSAAAFEAATSIDPSFGLAWGRRGLAQWTLGHRDDALASLDRCTTALPNATICLVMRHYLAKAMGKCDQAESDGRRLVLLEPDDGDAKRDLASLLWGRGSPDAAVETLLDQGADALAPADRVYAGAWSDTAFAIARGDFVAARQALDAYHAPLSTEPRVEPHGLYAAAAEAVAMETGRPSEAIRAARELLDRVDALHLDGPYLDGDRMAAWAALRVAGAISAGELDAHRQAWLASLPPSHNAWDLGRLLVAHVYEVQTPAEASRGLDALAPYLAVFTTDDADDDEQLGRAYLLAGRLEPAISYLRRATTSCAELWNVFTRTRATYFYGTALEQKGDNAGACAAYAAVLDRWGRAKPRSITAEHARDRAKRLGCGR